MALIVHSSHNIEWPHGKLRIVRGLVTHATHEVPLSDLSLLGPPSVRCRTRRSMRRPATLWAARRSTLRPNQRDTQQHFQSRAEGGRSLIAARAASNRFEQNFKLLLRNRLSSRSVCRALVSSGSGNTKCTCESTLTRPALGWAARTCCARGGPPTRGRERPRAERGDGPTTGVFGVCGRVRLVWDRSAQSAVTSLPQGGLAARRGAG